MLSGTRQISGVVLKTPASHILTASLSLGTGPLVTIQTRDGQSFDGWIVGRNDKQNLALVRVVGAPSLPGIEIGDSIRLTTGDEVVSLGYPSGALSAVPTSILAVRQDFISGIAFLQIDIQPQPGTEGGPVVNRNGQLVAMNVASTFVQDIGLTVSPGSYALIADFISPALAPLEAGAITISRPPLPSNPTDPPPPIPAILVGTVTFKGAAPPVGTWLYGRLVHVSLGDAWFRTKIKENGAYALTIGTLSPFYRSRPIEFYIDGIKSDQTSTFTEASNAVLNLTFS